MQIESIKGICNKYKNKFRFYIFSKTFDFFSKDKLNAIECFLEFEQMGVKNEQNIIFRVIQNLYHARFRQLYPSIVAIFHQFYPLKDS